MRSILSGVALATGWGALVLTGQQLHLTPAYARDMPSDHHVNRQLSGGWMRRGVRCAPEQRPEPDRLDVSRSRNPTRTRDR
jgi:hypothetical protein